MQNNVVRSLAVLGLAGICSSVAHAEFSANVGEGSISLGGNLATQLENIKATGATNASVSNPDKPARWRVSNVSSDFTVKAAYPLGNAMTAVGQLTTGVQTDGNGQSGQGSLWSSAKDVFVGLSMDNVGTIKLGRMTAASRWIAGTVDFSPAAAGPQDDQAAYSKTGGGTAKEASFNDRIDNAIGFESATWNGFSFRAYYGADENRSNTQHAAGTADVKDSTYSLGLQYVIGPLDLRFAHEVRQDKNTLNNASVSSVQSGQGTDKDTRIALRYTLSPDTILAFGYGKMKFTDTVATGSNKSSLDRSGWVIGAKQFFGNGKHAVYGGYGRSGNYSCTNANGSTCNGSNTGMKNVVLAYNYQFNKQMVLEAFIAQVANQSAAKYDFDSGGLGVSTGAKTSVIGTGFRFSF